MGSFSIRNRRFSAQFSGVSAKWVAMKQTILHDIIAPILIFVLTAVGTLTAVPNNRQYLGPGLVLGSVILLIIYWGIRLAQWLRQLRFLETVAYLLANLVIALGIIGMALATGMVISEEWPVPSSLIPLLGFLPAQSGC